MLRCHEAHPCRLGDALFCEHVVPSISSIRQNCEALGERAVRELKRLLRTRKAGDIRAAILQRAMAFTR